jgi:hypothetical protein
MTMATLRGSNHQLRVDDAFGSSFSAGTHAHAHSPYDPHLHPDAARRLEAAFGVGTNYGRSLCVAQLPIPSAPHQPVPPSVPVPTIPSIPVPPPPVPIEAAFGVTAGSPPPRPQSFGVGRKPGVQTIDFGGRYNR